MVRTYEVNEVRFVKGFRLHRQSRQIRNYYRKIPILVHTWVTCSELPSNISTMHYLHSQDSYIFLPDPRGFELFKG